MKYDYLIVGAGLYSAVFAHEMTQHGKRCLVIEKRRHIGGNCYTESIGGINVHKYGAHIFHTSDTTIRNYINGFAEFNNFVNSPVAIYKDELYNLPFNMNTFSKMWSISSPNEAMEIIEKQRSETGISEPKNLEEQALYLVGRDIFEKLIKGYTEKQWGRPCSELPPFIIKRIPLRFTYDNNYFNDKYQGIPIGGYTKIIEKMLDGCDIMLNTDYFEFIQSNSGIVKKTLYTGEIDRFFNYKYGRLEYRSLRFETERLDLENFQGNAVVNYTASNVPFTRIIEHKHFEFGTQKDTVITREFPKPFVDGAEPYYPVNDERNNTIFEQYKKHSEQLTDVIFGGRLGMYKYFDMDKIIGSALAAAHKELNG